MRISVQSQTGIVVSYLRFYLFSVSISAFVCLYSMADRTWTDELPILRFETCVEDELFNIGMIPRV